MTEATLDPYIDSDASNLSDVSETRGLDDPEDATYTIRPPIKSKFNVDRVKDLLKLVVFEELEGKRYNSFKPEEMSKHLCELIQQKLTEFPYEGYKYVIEAILAENKGQGMAFQSKCLWDPDTDNVATEFINTEYVICVITVFGVYYY